jgi:hypothetical protein
MWSGVKSLMAVLMLLLGALMTLMGVMGLSVGDFHGPYNAIFNLVVGAALVFGGWKLFPAK